MGDACDQSSETPGNLDVLRCILEINGGFAKVAKAQGKVNVDCIKTGAKGTLVGTIENCLTSHGKGRVAKATQRTLGGAAEKCIVTPGFGPADPNNPNSTSEAKCQADIAKRVQKCQDVILGACNDCKKRGLRGQSTLGGANVPFESASDLELCMGDDPKVKIAKTCDTKLAAALSKKCGGVRSSTTVC